jgi:hypothetical protein
MMQMNGIANSAARYLTVTVLMQGVGRTLDFFNEAYPSLTNEFGKVATIVGGSRCRVNVRLLLQFRQR